MVNSILYHYLLRYMGKLATMIVKILDYQKLCEVVLGVICAFLLMISTFIMLPTQSFVLEFLGAVACVVGSIITVEAEICSKAVHFDQYAVFMDWLVGQCMIWPKLALSILKDLHRNLPILGKLNCFRFLSTIAIWWARIAFCAMIPIDSYSFLLENSQVDARNMNCNPLTRDHFIPQYSLWFMVVALVGFTVVDLAIWYLIHGYYRLAGERQEFGLIRRAVQDQDFNNNNV